MLKIKIIVCTHTQSPCLQDEVYTPIQLGRADVDYDLGFQTDLDGINIGNKNFYYSEFTGLYWAWKNLKGIDYIGLNHYRRYFFLNEKKNIKRAYTNISHDDLFEIDFSKDVLVKYFSEFDIILPHKKIFTNSIWKIMSGMHGKIEMKIMENTVKKLYPEYTSSIDKYLKYTNRLELNGIFITKWKIFDKYCEWLFSILFEIEKQIDPLKNSLHKGRKLGFLAELLTAVYFNHNNLRIKHLLVAYVNPNEKNKSWFRYYGSYIKSTLRFWFNV